MAVQGEGSARRSRVAATLGIASFTYAGMRQDMIANRDEPSLLLLKDDSAVETENQRIIDDVMTILPVVLHELARRGSYLEVLENYCPREGIAYLPWCDEGTRKPTLFGDWVLFYGVRRGYMMTVRFYEGGNDCRRRFFVCSFRGPCIEYDDDTDLDWFIQELLKRGELPPFSELRAVLR
jgi:hypothetical protein